MKVIYKNGTIENRTFTRGDEMSNPRIKDIIIEGNQQNLSHTWRLILTKGLTG